jgi:hypothetical protein
MLRIHLVYVKGLVNENNVEDIRKSIATIEGEKETGMKATASKDDADGNTSIGYEFMMEVSNLEEKYAWLAAIDAHTSYIEAIANYGNAGELGNWQLGQEIEIDESRSPSLASIYPSITTTGKNASVLETMFVIYDWLFSSSSFPVFLGLVVWGATSSIIIIIIS